MAKHRKTRQQKMVADQRHVLYHLETSTAQVSPPVEKKPKAQDFKLEIPTHATHPITASYAYVKTDLRKTALITGAIVIAQIFLFIILNRM